MFDPEVWSSGDTRHPLYTPEQNHLCARYCKTHGLNWQGCVIDHFWSRAFLSSYSSIVRWKNKIWVCKIIHESGRIGPPPLVLCRGRLGNFRSCVLFWVFSYGIVSSHSKVLASIDVGRRGRSCSGLNLHLVLRGWYWVSTSFIRGLIDRQWWETHSFMALARWIGRGSEKNIPFYTFSREWSGLLQSSEHAQGLESGAE